MSAHFCVSLPGTPDSVPAARNHVREWLSGCSLLDDVLQILSEIATNAVEHSDSRLPGHEFQVAVLRDDHAVRVEVHDDGSAGQPVVKRPGGDALGGRGMFITEALSQAWGTNEDARGRVVWYIVADHSAVAAA